MCSSAWWRPRAAVLLALLNILLTVSCSAAGTPTNRTIDDEEGDSVSGLKPEYLPSGAWSQGATCSGCLARLDPSQTFDGTWHDSTFTPGIQIAPTITLRFNGTAVYVYNVLANSVPFADTLTNLTFILDGATVGTFVHPPTTSTLPEYNVLVFMGQSLKNIEHELVIQATRSTKAALTLFDRVVYTFVEDSLATTSSFATITNNGNLSTSAPQPLGTPLGGDDQTAQRSSSPTTAIVGGILGSAVAILLAAVLFFVFRKHRRRNRPRVRISIDSCSTYVDSRAGGTRDNNIKANVLSASEATFAAGVYVFTNINDGDRRLLSSRRGPSSYGTRARTPPRPDLARTGDAACTPFSSYATSAPPSYGAYLYGKEAGVYKPPEADALPSALPSSTMRAHSPPAKGALVLRNPSTETTTSALRSKVAALQKEVEQLQEEKVLRDYEMNTEALPVYKEEMEYS